MNSHLTVTSASPTIELTTVETVRDELPDTTLSDDTIRRWIGEESDKIAAYCNRVFGSETLSEVFYPDRCVADVLIASRMPINSITSVIENDDDALDDTLYQINANAGLIYRLDYLGNRINWTVERVTVVYVAGYTLVSTLPRAIESACIQMVTRRAYMRGRDPLLRSEAVDGASTLQWWVAADSDGMTSSIREMLDPYVERPF